MTFKLLTDAKVSNETSKNGTSTPLDLPALVIMNNKLFPIFWSHLYQSVWYAANLIEVLEITKTSPPRAYRNT